jgi:hypothetical protein
LRSSGHFFLGDIWKVFRLLPQEPRHRQIKLLSEIDKVEWARESKSDDSDSDVSEGRGPDSSEDGGPDVLHDQDSDSSEIREPDPSGNTDLGEERRKICQELPWIYWRMGSILYYFITLFRHENPDSDSAPPIRDLNDLPKLLRL